MRTIENPPAVAPFAVPAFEDDDRYEDYEFLGGDQDKTDAASE